MAVRGVVQFPEDRYKGNNDPGAAIPFSVDCPLLGFYHAVGYMREFAFILWFCFPNEVMLEFFM
jgi:hypothetical protein